MENKNIVYGDILAMQKRPLFLLPPLAVLVVFCLGMNLAAGIAAAVFALCYLVFTLWWLRTSRKRIRPELAAFARGFQDEHRRQLENMPVPYAILGDGGRLIWANRILEEQMPAELDEEERATQLLPAIGKNLPEDFENRTEHIQWNNRAYEAQVQRLSSEPVMYSLLLFDETNHLQALNEIEEQKAVIGQVYIDNFDEVMNSAETVRQSLLAALIERKISKYFAGYDGIVRKTEKDRFVVFMKKKGLMAMQEDRFSILEDVKTLNIGNNISVTLSISMGSGGMTMEQNSVFSRNAMDLALGRGGDQAIVKTPENTKYYGGKTQRQARNTRVKARVKAQALRELMLTRDQILIMGHRIPDVDAFGSAVGVYRVARTLSKPAHIVMDEVSSSVRPLVNRFLNNSDYPDDMILKKEQAVARLNANTMVVVVDTNRPSYTECPELLDKAGTVVVLDHHRQGGETIRRATLSYIEPYASSASEMVAEILQYLNETPKLRPIEAETIYAGIVIDTDNFMNKAGVRTFEAAAYLRRHGADVTRVRKLFRERIEDMRAKAETISSAEIFADCFAVGICPGGGVESPTIVGAQAANEMLDIMGVKATIVLTEYNNTIYVSARSIDEINVQLIMERLGGGGHLSVAGAQLKNCTVEEAKQKVQETILQMLEEGAI